MRVWGFAMDGLVSAWESRQDDARLTGPTSAETREEPERTVSASGVPDWIGLAALGFVALGVMLRLVRYLLNFPLWCDETMLAANLLDRSYLELLQPLDYRQVCPVLFLFIELTAVKLLGFSEFSLRLFPFACGVASVFVFWHVARRLLRGEALVCALAVFAVSNWPLRYAGEVKPYASDLFIALVFLAFAIEWWLRPERTRWLWALVGFAPLAIATSFPAIFAAGGVGIGLLVPVWRARRRGVWVPYVAFNACVGLTFVALLRFYQTAPQDHAYFHHDWAPAFPPLNHIGSFAAWFLSMNTGFMFAYPDGGQSGASSLTFLCFVIAVVSLARRRMGTVLALGLTPFALCLAAAALHRYPYGMSARTMQFVAPTICLFAGLGIAALIGKFRAARVRHRVLAGLLAALAVMALGRMSYDLLYPYKSAEDERHRGFARWFWPELARSAELTCPKVDFGLEFRPQHWNTDATDTYLCYQKIYSPRHASGAPPRLDRVSDARPLRVVFYNEVPDKIPAFQSWLAEMSRTFDLRKIEPYPISVLAPKQRITWGSLYIVYEFVPKPGQTERKIAALPGTPPRR